MVRYENIDKNKLVYIQSKYQKMFIVDQEDLCVLFQWVRDNNTVVNSIVCDHTGVYIVLHIRYTPSGQGRHRESCRFYLTVDPHNVMNCLFEIVTTLDAEGFKQC